MKEKRLAGAALYHIIIFAIGIIMVYPLIWMVMSSFKETNTIFTTASSLIPEHFVTITTQTAGKDLQRSLSPLSLKTLSSSP